MGTRIVPSSLRLAAPLNPVNDRFTGAFIQTMLRTRLKTTLKLTSTTFSESLCSVCAPGPQASREREQAKLTGLRCPFLTHTVRVVADSLVLP